MFSSFGAKESSLSAPVNVGPWVAWRVEQAQGPWRRSCAWRWLAGRARGLRRGEAPRCAAYWQASQPGSAMADRESVGEGKRVDLGGCRVLKKKKKENDNVDELEEAGRTLHHLGPLDVAAINPRPGLESGVDHRVVHWQI